MGSLWTSTSSLGFPGGSLGHPGTAGAVMFICRPLRPYLDLVVLDNATSLPHDVLMGR